MVICLERDVGLHMAKLMPLPLTVSYFSKIQIGFTFLVPAQPGSPGKRAIKQLYVSEMIRFYFTLSAYKTYKNTYGTSHSWNAYSLTSFS